MGLQDSYMLSRERVRDYNEIRKIFRKKFLAFVRSKWGESPFLDKPNRSSYGSSASIGVSKRDDGPSVSIYGGRPNISRMKGYTAPVAEYAQTDPYRRRARDSFYTSKKYQKKAADASPYDDLSSRPSVYRYQYFGVDGYNGGSTVTGFRMYGPGSATLTYWEKTIADFFMERYEDDINGLLDDAIWEAFGGKA